MPAILELPGFQDIVEGYGGSGEVIVSLFTKGKHVGGRVRHLPDEFNYVTIEEGNECISVNLDKISRINSVSVNGVMIFTARFPQTLKPS